MCWLGELSVSLFTFFNSDNKNSYGHAIVASNLIVLFFLLGGDKE